MPKEDYLKMGMKRNDDDKELSRGDVRRIEKLLNNHTRALIKIFKVGEEHGHLKRVTESKLQESENCAPKYYMYKDHKREGGWRPVVSGCSSNTLGLSNLMSDVIESLACGFEDPYEVISSQDMLSRFEDYNRVLEKDVIKERDKGIDYDWRDEKMLIGSDVVALFPSLSKANTIKAVKSQLSKSKVE